MLKNKHACKKNKIKIKIWRYNFLLGENIFMKSQELYIKHGDRLRKRFAEHGLDCFDEHEVLELLLSYGGANQNSEQLAHELINEFGSFVNLLDSDPMSIINKCGLDINTAVILSIIPSLARLYFKNKYLDEGKILNSTKKIGNYAVALLTGRDFECFYIICLNKQKKLLKSVLIASGTIDETPFYPRDIVEASLKYKATSIVLVHNHPGCSFLPSQNDISSTRMLKNTLEPLRIEVLDHVIVAGDQYYSFVERNRF